MQKLHSGLVVPLATPATKTGEIDEPALVRITERVAEAACPILVLGTTGEAVSLSLDRREKAVKTVLDTVSGRVKVYAGIGATRPQESLDMGRTYLELGVDAAVAHPPFYYPMAAEELLRHYTWLADNLPGPLMLYNIPITTKISIPFDTISKLSHHPNIVGIKDSERDAERQKKGATTFGDREDFSFFTGVGTLIADGVAWGADGAVPASGNIMPALFQEVYETACNGDLEHARKLQATADSLSMVYQEGHTVNRTLAALKVVLAELGLCEAHMFPPVRP